MMEEKGTRMASKRSDFENFMQEVEQESEAAGKSGDLAAYREHFRLALELIGFRAKLGLTQQQLARKSGVQQSEISRIERGEGNPTYRTMQALAAGLGRRVALVPDAPKRNRRSVKVLSGQSRPR
jgi:DNA-binding XRE family transcriptional regulator